MSNFNVSNYRELLESLSHDIGEMQQALECLHTEHNSTGVTENAGDAVERFNIALQEAWDELAELRCVIEEQQ